MANEDTNKGLPIPYITAVWSGMSSADIEAGLAAGSILRPDGVPEDSTADAAAFGSIAEGLRATSTGSATAAAADGTHAATTADSTVTAAVAADGIFTAIGSDSNTDGRKQVEEWLRALDPSLTDGTFDAVWTRAGATDAERATTLQRFLGETLLGEADAGHSALDTFVADPAHRARVVDLHGMTGAELARLASEDTGYRHALATRQPLALTGNRALFAHANAVGALDRFDPDTGEQLVSDAWLADRAKLLAWTSADSEDMVVTGSEDWTFVDRTSIDAEGNPSTFELSTGNADAGENQVVFGHDDDELLQGVRGSDRMYGGDGNDILRGAAGGDHLEGGRGDDLVLGGAGNDELAGNQGADELEGGRGSDRLTGGSGNDNLAGGRGGDHLEGGAGIDTYVIDEGDGADVIVDADGAGVIELDGMQIGGTMSAKGDGSWTSADGRIELALSGDPNEAGTLTIRASGEDGHSAPASPDVITVRNWKNGDLGITLAGTPAASSTAGPNYDLSSITGPEIPVLSTEDLSADVATGETGSAEQADAGAGVGADMGPGVSADIAWGDVAPVGVGNAAASSTSAADGSDAIADDVSSPSAAAFDAAFADAIAAIFGTDPGAFTALEPAHVESAIQAFSGVLEAPDITAAAGFVPADAGNAVTAHDYADALAGDFAYGDIGNEAAMTMQLPMVPDVRSSEMTFTQLRNLGADR